jgi:phosphate transport system substrate-binding protein
LLKNSAISSNHSALEHNQDVINYVTERKDIIGVIGVSWLSDKDDSTMMSFLKKVRVMALSKDSIATWDNSYQPYQAYIAHGNYPLFRNIYAIDADPRRGLTTGFTAFLASDRGQRIILKTGILPATQPYRIINAKKYEYNYDTYEA